MKNKKLYELAKSVRSKNAGVDRITFDVIFNEKKNYELVKKSKVLSKQSVADLFGIDESQISDFVEFDPAFAIKFTIQRENPAVVLVMEIFLDVSSIHLCLTWL